MPPRRAPPRRPPRPPPRLPRRPKRPPRYERAAIVSPSSVAAPLPPLRSYPGDAGRRSRALQSHALHHPPSLRSFQVAAAAQAQAAAESDENDPLKDKYGDLEMVQSVGVTDRKWTRISELSEALVGKNARVENRGERGRRGRGGGGRLGEQG